ncbi:hypothetical protein KAFR_0F01990 [Kazachstania africana CBS 2517]|uniref:Mitochondrial thiamine pyrophosphate carrier 1 n=1 Tax=Kazachstania africana (strain ATCC 22294 / BCRC 22015 / CBS 2517 / CECT 1963 / NBRC 1671 / NRRL Y-8276) TaxID=1071382 RepID=H2AWP6_KAZAF|nr:hypothetical protein KAFR_0F01990 [Kazachstania africana CBS 2517]CCF58796.1 hypothetical protein KAFR_0F01990 [Kazachstania africana CBS 2517]
MSVDNDNINYESLPEDSSLYAQLLAGAFAGIMEHSVMFPIDALKTRIQANHMSTKLLSQISKISASEGSFALWKGVQSVILGAGPAHAVYFGTYEFCKAHLIEKDKLHTHQPVKTAISGAMATIASDALLNPFDTIKQRMQLATRSKIWNTMKSIYKNEGFIAFYYSYPATIAMNIPFTALNFVVYESSIKLFNPTESYNPLIHCLSGGISGALAAATTTPLDVIKTTLQVRGSEKVQLQVLRKADTFNKAAVAIYKIYGWKGFLKGLKPRVIASIPATAISWTSYECAKHFLLPRHNGY